MPPLATSLRHLFALVLENLNNKVGTASCEKNIDLIVLIFTQVCFMMSQQGNKETFLKALYMKNELPFFNFNFKFG